MTELNPFTWGAADFLIFYFMAFAASLVAGMAIASALRPEGRSLAVTQDDELAVLAGGRDRLGEMVLARMLAAGQASIDNGRIWLAPSRPGSTGLEREILGLREPPTWGKIKRALADGAERIEHDLVRKGHWMERGEARQLGLFAALPLILLFAAGVARHQFGVALGRPVGILTVFLVVTAIAILVRVLATNRLTKAGTEAIKQARARSARLRQAPTRDETGTAVALFGTAILVGSPLAALHTLRSSDGGSGGGGDSGDGGGGCGGGGCGG